MHPYKERVEFLPNGQTSRASSAKRREVVGEGDLHPAKNHLFVWPTPRGGGSASLGMAPNPIVIVEANIICLVHEHNYLRGGGGSPV